jgi:hypothetical protein
MRRKTIASRWRRWFCALVWISLLIGTGAWSVLAIAYAARGPSWLPLALAGSVAIFAIANLLLLPRRTALAFGLILFGGTLAWWLHLSPSNDRDWEPEYATLARASVDGNRVLLTNVRDAVYGNDGSVAPAYYNAAYRLDQLDEVDLISSYWAGDAIAHVFLSFGFTDGRHVAISVETRREKGEAYTVIGGFFRHFELIYVVGDERDMIGARTDGRRERLYLYRIQATAAEKRQLFLSYLDRIARLAETPEFYNTLYNNCTTNVVWQAKAAGGIPLNWKILITGYADQYAYQLGLLDQALPFGELKRRSLVRRAPDAKIDANFSADIRRGLPG